MNNIISKVGMFSVLISVSVYGWAGGPCKPIAEACMHNGYFKGGSKEHKGLVMDCVMPVTMGKMMLPNTHFTPMQLQQCKIDMTAKMKQKMQ